LADGVAEAELVEATDSTVGTDGLCVGASLAVTEDGVTDEKEDVEVGWDDASVLGMAVAVSAGVVVG
jgi:hypothetical protein